jgi:hypothetical protein
MPFTEDRLTPRDGLNNFTISVAHIMPQMTGRGGMDFHFAVTDSMQPVAELKVMVASRGQGLDQMMVEAHDSVIDILRQLVFRADKSRAAYDRFSRRGDADAAEDELRDVELL